MVGDGEDLGMIKEYVSELGLTDVISFTGMIEDKHHVASLLSQSDLLLLFSRYETMSVVAAEALACGVPVVATKMGALPEIVLPEFGILVDNENETQLCEAIYKVLTQPELFNRDEMRKFALANFSEEAIRIRLLELYDKYI
jgi:glycosyltransferase involved in cell wall biosynthesis